MVIFFVLFFNERNMNLEKNLLKKLEAQWIVRDWLVNVTFVTWWDYRNDVMQYGHWLSLRNHEFSIEKQISLDILDRLEWHKLLTKHRYIHLMTYKPIDFQKNIIFKHVELWSKQLSDVLNFTRNIFRQIIASGRKINCHIVSSLQAAPNIQKKQ